VKVVEVASRADSTGRTFLRFGDGENAEETAKLRGRALRQAVRSAQYDQTLLGITGEVPVTELASK
jgi:hypothetical protein